MIRRAVALIALGALAVAPATGAPQRAARRAAIPAAPPAPSADEQLARSAEATRLARWIAREGDNRGLPYAIVDKPGARLFLFDADHQLRAAAPVLIGIAPGDSATPGVGSKKLAELGPSEKTTPAGRFLARFGRAAGKARVLWVDYATSVAIHPIPADASPKERRRQRIRAADPAAHRITFGCINVPSALYTRSIRPRFAARGGYVYVLPDSAPIEMVFPGLRTLDLPMPF